MSENYTINLNEAPAALEALQWYLDHGVDEVLLETPQDRTKIPDISTVIAKSAPPKNIIAPSTPATTDMMGAAEAIMEAQKLTEQCDNLDALQQAIMDFDGLSVKKTATNMVFSDGNPKAQIMVIGEAPEAQEDIEGKPFVGQSGQLLDKILACIDLDRKSDDMKCAVYITNILNWRPPGNRTPTKAEMDISYPFIARHIALVKPKIIIICGSVAGKALLKREESMSKMRGSFHEIEIGGHSCLALTTYHPTYLLRTPAQKKAVWADMLMLQEKMIEVL